MAKEEKLLTVQSKLSDRDFDDVYRIYLDTERNSDKRIGLITCAALAAICLFLMILFHNFTFIFYAAGCVIIGISYYLVPVNKKFIATNKLLYGEWREITFYPHSVSTMEIFDKDEAKDMDADEIEDATTSFSTTSIKAYENNRGFLFADGKIVNQFVYVPKQGLSRSDAAEIRKYAEENCSGGYELLEGASLIEEDVPGNTEDAGDPASLTANVCDQYYGAKKLHLYDAEGHRVHMDEDESDEYADADEDDADAQDDSIEIAEAPELDVEEAFEDVTAEDDEEPEDE